MKPNSKLHFEWAEITRVFKADNKSTLYDVRFKQEIFISDIFISKEIKNSMKLKKGQEVLLALRGNWTAGFITESGLSYFVSPMDLLPNNVRKKCLTEIS